MVEPTGDSAGPGSVRHIEHATRPERNPQLTILALTSLTRFGAGGPTMVRIRRFGVLRTATVAAVIYFILTAVFAIPAALIFSGR